MTTNRSSESALDVVRRYRRNSCAPTHDASRILERVRDWERRTIEAAARGDVRRTELCARATRRGLNIMLRVRELQLYSMGLIERPRYVPKDPPLWRRLLKKGGA